MANTSEKEKSENLRLDWEFPVIKNLSDVLKAIEGRKEFTVAKKEWGTVVNYKIDIPDTFPDVETVDHAIRRECRGIMFDLEGRILARRLHKFFNVNEKVECRVENLDLSKPHRILEKLDGSMITPMLVGDRVRWGTKMGLTDVAKGAEKFVSQNPHYLKFALFLVYDDITPIFEWCSRSQRIVIDHETDRLVLLAARVNVTGEYLSYEQLLKFGKKYDIEVVKAYEGTVKNMEALVSQTRALEGSEGWVVRFDNGHMVKIKSEWYMHLHKSRDIIAFEKNVLRMIFFKTMDDAKSIMGDEDRAKVEAYEKAVWEGVEKYVDFVDTHFEAISHLDRRGYAQQYSKADQQKDQHLPGIIFRKFSCSTSTSTMSLVIDLIKKYVGTQTHVEKIRHILGAVW